MRILIVDDEPNIGIVFRRHLERLGYTAERGHRIDIAEDGESCRAQALTPPAPDIIFMDGAFPGGSGPVIVLELRQRGYTTKIVMMSSDAELNRNGMEAGADMIWEEKVTLCKHFNGIFTQLGLVS
ncbi:MAG: response regulator [bacterium]|nr:response regulator [bacterium]